MPEKYIHRDYTDSRRIDQLDALEERFFSRLMQKADDHGRILNDDQLLNSKLFPLKRNIRDTDIARWKAKCLSIPGLIRCYVDAKGRSILQIENFGQTKKHMRSAFDPPDGQQNFSLPPPEVEVNRIEVKSQRAPEKHFPDAAVPTWPEVLAYAQIHGVPEISARAFFDHHENNSLWLNQYQRLINWKSKLITWSANDRQPKPNHANHRSSCPDRNAGTFNTARTRDQISSKVRRVA